MELQGIEPWSREDERVRSTCLAAFDCREQQGRQQPKLLRSRCFSTPPRDTTGPSSAERHRVPASAKQKDRAMMASQDLIPGQANLTLGQIKQPWRRYSRHVDFESRGQSSTLTSLHAGIHPHTSCQNRSAPNKVDNGP